MQLTPEQKEFIRVHERDDVRETALRFVRPDLSLLLMQISGRQMAMRKIPSWYKHPGIVYPSHLSLEQSSSELTARYKVSLFLEGEGSGMSSGRERKELFFGKPANRNEMAEGVLRYSGRETFADLSGGMGVDFSFLSPLFREAAYVEDDNLLCQVAEHNFQLLGLKNSTVYHDDAKSFLQKSSRFDMVYLDPSRRDKKSGQKLFRVEDCSPNLVDILTLLFDKSTRAMVKYSPMLDIALAIKSLERVNEVHVVSVNNECKELLFILSKKVVVEPLFVAVNFTATEQETFLFTREQEREAVVSYAENPGRYLYEPNASILKAGAFKSVAEQFSIQKLHVNSHLYTSDELIFGFPGRVFEVNASFQPNKKNVRTFLERTKKANITVRNFPMTVAEIRRKTGLEEGGDLYMFATTLSDGRKAWVTCKKVIK